jgi:lathosterol oxidase
MFRRATSIQMTTMAHLLTHAVATLPGTFLLLSIAGLLFMLPLVLGSYFVFFVWHKRRFHPRFVADVATNRRALVLSVLNVVGSAALTSPVHWLIIGGHTRVYYSIADRGWGWFVTSIVLYLVVVETTVYWIHRALHTRWLYKHVHRLHHEHRVPTPLSSYSFHPLDAFLQAVPQHLFVLFVPVHLGVYVVFLSFTAVWTVLIHDRVPFVHWRGINNTDHHTVHHWFQKYNLGQFFTLWDRLGGTYRDPEALPPTLEGM